MVDTWSEVLVQTWAMKRFVETSERFTWQSMCIAVCLSASHVSIVQNM